MDIYEAISGSLVCIVRGYENALKNIYFRFIMCMLINVFGCCYKLMLLMLLFI